MLKLQRQYLQKLYKKTTQAKTKQKIETKNKNTKQLPKRRQTRKVFKLELPDIYTNQSC